MPKVGGKYLRKYRNKHGNITYVYTEGKKKNKKPELEVSSDSNSDVDRSQSAYSNKSNRILVNENNLHFQSKPLPSNLLKYPGKVDFTKSIEDNNFLILSMQKNTSLQKSYLKSELKKALIPYFEITYFRKKKAFPSLMILGDYARSKVPIRLAKKYKPPLLTYHFSKKNILYAWVRSKYYKVATGYGIKYGESYQDYVVFKQNNKNISQKFTILYD